MHLITCGEIASMRGFASEALICSGAFLINSHPVISGFMIVLGVCCAFARFSISFVREQKKEKLIDATEKILTSISKNADEINLRSFAQGQNFH